MESIEIMHPEKLESNAKWSKDVEHLLPKITSSLLNGVSTCKIEQDTENKIFRHHNAYHPQGISHRFKIPITHPSNRKTTNHEGYNSASDVRNVFVVHHDQEHKRAVRSFIGGLSHCYNNLLMGIWGNASLIGMILDKKHPIQPHLSQIEALIQDGSNLIHLLFGYIVERRTAAKRLRLKQLVQEIESYHHISGNEINFPIFKTGIIRLSKILDKRQLAACISPVINQMLTLVQEKRSAMNPHCHDLLKAKAHLDKIDDLLMRGFQLIRNLDYFAAAIKPQKKYVNLKSIIRNYLGNNFVECQDAAVTRDLSTSIPRIYIDPNQITHALKQLVDNAHDAVSDNGKIHIKVNTLNSENPQERCGVHTLSNYVVITVEDNGKGMATSTQAQIFDPFYTGYKGQGKAGLGLSAAAGIIRSHGGYIQVRSKQNQKSTVKIYLPMRHRPLDKG